MSKRSIIIVLLLFWIGGRVSAQAPGWGVNPSEYGNSMSYTGFVVINGDNEGVTEDIIAAFYNEEVRGVASPVWFEETRQWIFYMTIYSNINNQEITFKYYNSRQNKIINLSTTINFGADQITGSSYEPKATSDVPLTEAEMLSFSLPGQLNNRILNDEINVIVPQGTLLNDIVADFKASPGAVVKSGGVVQISGVSRNDYTNGLFLTVHSGDQLSMRNYKLNVVAADYLKLEASSVVTPNGDGINDTWIVLEPDKYYDSQFIIFDASGRKVFERTGYDNSWKGDFNNQLLPAGTYYYTIQPPSGNILKGVISLVH